MRGRGQWALFPPVLSGAAVAITLPPVIGRSLLFLCLVSDACGTAVAAPVPRPRYLYYLHGKIVEDFGVAGVSPHFGRYDYPGILQWFRAAGFTVISEVREGHRPCHLRGKAHGRHQCRMKSGVHPNAITVVGASKGSVMAMLVSSPLRKTGVRYVFLANCNNWLERTYAPRFSGEVLSIYESSDDVGGSCRPIAQRSRLPSARQPCSASRRSG